jgi:hypothetical protein
MTHMLNGIGSHIEFNGRSALLYRVRAVIPSSFRNAVPSQCVSCLAMRFCSILPR